MCWLQSWSLIRTASAADWFPHWLPSVAARRKLGEKPPAGSKDFSSGVRRAKISSAWQQSYKSCHRVLGINSEVTMSSGKKGESKSALLST